MSVKIESLIKFQIILLLNEGPKHGYDLMKKLGEKLKKKISASQVYPFLNILEKNKLVKIKKIGAREKKVYSLTNEGKRFISSFLQRFGDLLNIALEPKLTICVHCGCKVYKGGHAEKIKGKRLMFCCHHCAKSFKKI